MKRPALALLLSCLTLSACTEAGAVQFDTSNDAHCLALMASLFSAAQQDAVNATPYQQHATAIMFHWYLQTVDPAEVKRAGGPDAFDRKLEQLLKRNFPDHRAAKDEVNDCAERAINDANFEKFAATIR